jgi:hypothetical protein
LRDDFLGLLLGRLDLFENIWPRHIRIVRGLYHSVYGSCGTRAGVTG